MDCFFDARAAAVFDAARMKKVNLYESPRMFCDVYCLLPGQEQQPHEHAENDKIYFALTGECTALIGAKRRVLRPGELAVAPAGVIHGVVNESQQPATLLVIMAPHPKYEFRNFGDTQLNSPSSLQ